MKYLLFFQQCIPSKTEVATSPLKSEVTKKDDMSNILAELETRHQEEMTKILAKLDARHQAQIERVMCKNTVMIRIILIN